MTRTPCLVRSGDDVPIPLLGGARRDAIASHYRAEPWACKATHTVTVSIVSVPA